MKEKKIEVGYFLKRVWDIDFGMINRDSRDGTIKVNKKFWEEYVNKRYDFEIMHDFLIGKLPKKIRKPRS